MAKRQLTLLGPGPAMPLGGKEMVDHEFVAMVKVSRDPPCSVVPSKPFMRYKRPVEKAREVPPRAGAGAWGSEVHVFVGMWKDQRSESRPWAGQPAWR